MNSRIFADKGMVFLKKYNSYTEREELLAHYGLETIYILITKTIFVTIVSLLIGITKEMYIFILFYGMLRIFASGMHLSRSVLCTIISTIILVVFPLLCIHAKIQLGLKIILLGIGIICFGLFSPADTHKKPLINSKIRISLKIKSSIVLLIYTLLTITIKNDYISNTIVFSVVLQVILILPVTYKMFNMPYNNYLNYKEE